MTERWASAAQNIAKTGLLLAVVITPLVISRNGDDAFRLPKLLFFQACTLAMAAVVCWLVIYDVKFRERLRRHDFPAISAAVAVAWTGIVTLLSRNPTVSHDAPFNLFCYALFFLMLVVLPAPRPLTFLAVVTVPALVTSLYGIAQYLKLQTPLIVHDTGGTRRQIVALLGNPNYVATFLVIPIIVLTAAMFTWPKRAIWISMAAIPMIVAMGATLTVTAAAAIVSATLAFFFTVPTRTGRQLLAVLLIGAAASTMLFTPARKRLIVLATQLQSGNYDTLSSYRLPAFAAAAMMFRERPIVGVGPGVFGAQYMTYRLRVDEQHPEWVRDINANFGEVHNDHLQLLAEAGLPAYLIFLAFSVRLGQMSFRRRASAVDEQTQFVCIFALPAVAGFFVLALAQFPMHLAASASMSLFVAAICFSWERVEP